jgi:two-component system chemotaxis response regulator CheB
MLAATNVYGGKILGVLLTGMGRDGAQGMLEIRQLGGRTIAQDEASCVVFGMPKAAIDLGAAEKIVPLPKVAQEIMYLV